MENHTPKDIALFRYQIIAPLLSISGPRGTLKREIERIASRPHMHPRRGQIAVGIGTIEDWLMHYRRDGLDGLADKRRRDLGKSRRIDADVADTIVDLAESRADLDGSALLAEVAAKLPAKEVPSLSTLYRFLRARGLDQRRSPHRKDHRAYAFDLAGDCWQGDVMHGPSLPCKDGKRKKVYLIAILDDATRIIVHAEFYFEEHLRSLKDCLKQAMQKRGLPRRFYFDNGKIFRSRLLLAVCARLGIELVHTRPYQPQGRAKLERWFRTVRSNFLTRVDLDRCEGIDALNRLLFGWVEGEYHQRPHRGIDGETPLDRWMRLSDGVRPPPVDIDLDTIFLDEVTRRVGKDGTLSLKGKRFEAGPRFIGHKVVVRYDPFDLRAITVRTASGDETRAFPVDLRANRSVRRESSPVASSKKPMSLHSLEQLARDVQLHEDDQDGEVLCV